MAAILLAVMVATNGWSESPCTASALSQTSFQCVAYSDPSGDARGVLAFNAEDIVVTLTLADADAVLAFNLASTPANVLEYRWGVKFDTDGDPLTGDANGFDTAMELTHWKWPGAEYSATIPEGTQHNTWILDGTSVPYGHAVTAYVAGPQTLVMAGDSSWRELAFLNQGDRMYLYTYERNSGQDTTAITTDASVADSSGDVVHGYIDILEGSIQRPFEEVGILFDGLESGDFSGWSNVVQDGGEG